MDETDERLEQRATRAAHDPAGLPLHIDHPGRIYRPTRPPQDERACLAPTGPGTVETTPPVDAEDNPHPHLT
ncbi:hypothetical protein GS426_00405 [Rhodococcus hoagii]|nr:hypothetical protein [Prescottella equi]